MAIQHDPAVPGCVPGCTDTEEAHCCVVTFGTVAARNEQSRRPRGLRVEVVQEHGPDGALVRHVALMAVDGTGGCYGDVIAVEDVPGLVTALAAAHAATRPGAAGLMGGRSTEVAVAHPGWCDPRACRAVGANVDHAEVPTVWEVGDVRVDVGLARTDEVFEGRVILGATVVRVTVEDTASVRPCGCPVASSVDLPLADAARLGGALADAVARLHAHDEAAA